MVFINNLKNIINLLKNVILICLKNLTTISKKKLFIKLVYWEKTIVKALLAIKKIIQILIFGLKVLNTL